MLKKNNLIKKFFVIGLCLMFGLFVYRPVTAQAVSITTTGGNVLATINPQNPGPNQVTTITLTSAGQALTQAKIEWRINGVVMPNNQNKPELTFTSGEVGSTSHIEANVTLFQPTKKTPDQVNIVITITPGDVDLIWEADTTAPFFYPGKKAAINISPIKVIALTNLKTERGENISPDTLIFEWNKNGKNITSQSGAGKNFLVFNPNGSSNHTVNLKITTPDGFRPKISVQKSLTIKTTEPKLLFYQDKPLTGLETNRAIKNNFNLTEPDISIKAVPFFFDQRDQNLGLIGFDWTINDKPVEDNKNSDFINLAKPADQTGSTKIGLTAKNRDLIINKILTIFYE